MSRSGRSDVLETIEPDDVIDGYHAADLASLSDAELMDAVGEIVSQPCKGLTSFTLHAPLELLARFGLLPLVDPADREMARIQMVASGAAYRAGVLTLPTPAAHGPFPDLETAGREFEDVFGAADSDGLEAIVLQMARQFGTSSLVHALTPRLLPTLTAASHAHIGLWLLMRHGASGDMRDASLLRPAARMLAADPDARLRSFSGMDIRDGAPLERTPAQLEADLLARLADPPKGGQPVNTSIRALMEAAESSGNIDALFGDLVNHALTGPQIEAGFRAVMRASAHAMLQHDTEDAKFGWSHCLTMPQAACGLSTLNMHGKLGLATTLVWSTAYRTILSDRALDFEHVPDSPAESISLREALHAGPDVAAGRFWHADPSEVDAMRRVLASEAAVRNDQHLVKYTRACLDLCGFDPASWRLYLASTAKLCAVWIAETPRERLPDRFLEGRATPT